MHHHTVSSTDLNGLEIVLSVCAALITAAILNVAHRARKILLKLSRALDQMADFTAAVGDLSRVLRQLGNPSSLITEIRDRLRSLESLLSPDHPETTAHVVIDPTEQP